MIVFVLAALAVFAVDQASKLAVVHWLRLPERPCPGAGFGCYDVAPPFLRFRMGWNDGVNFGLLGGQPEAARWLLIGLAVAICVWVTLWARRDGRARVMAAAGLLVGGALGNVADRLRWGAVADFLNMSCCGIANPYAFNIADIGVFAGAIALVVWSGGRERA